MMVDTYYTYDAVERPLRTRYSVNGGSSVTLSDCSYDELGRLTTDYRNGNPKLITTYAYNLHGLPTAIRTPLFHYSARLSTTSNVIMALLLSMVVTRYSNKKMKLS